MKSDEIDFPSVKAIRLWACVWQVLYLLLFLFASPTLKWQIFLCAGFICNSIDLARVHIIYELRKK